MLRLLARGATNRQVSSRLAISPKTVGRHVEHIYTKAGVSSALPRRCSPRSTASWAEDVGVRLMWRCPCTDDARRVRNGGRGPRRRVP